MPRSPPRRPSPLTCNTAYFPGVPAIVDLVDVDSQKWFDYAAAARRTKSWLYRLEGRRTRGLEKEILAWSRAITLVSANEVELFHRVQNRYDGPVYPVTNGVDLDYFRPVAPAGPRAVACSSGRWTISPTSMPCVGSPSKFGPASARTGPTPCSGSSAASRRRKSWRWQNFRASRSPARAGRAAVCRRVGRRGRAAADRPRVTE